MTAGRSIRPYLQFPLCALSYSGPDRRECIISFCCVEHGRRRWNELAKADLTTLRRHGIDSCLESELRNQKRATWGCARFGALLLGYKAASAQLIVRQHMRLCGHIEKFVASHGPDPLVRVAADFVYGGDSRLSDPELAVLCAIYSKIGASRRPVRITRDDIWRRAHGFKSRRAFQVEMLGERSFTQRQVRSIIESLHARRFFARITFARRQTFYSHRLSAKDLKKAVVELKLRSQVTRIKRISNDKDLTARIRGERRKLAQSAATDAPLR